MRTRRHTIAGFAVLLLAAMGAHADVVAVVAAQSKVTALSKAQLTDIFLGRRTRYPDGSSAVPIDRQEGSMVRNAFYERFTGMSAAQIKAFWSKIIFTGRGQPPRSVASDAEMKKQLLAQPGAIGYLEQSAVDESLRVVTVE